MAGLGVQHFSPYWGETVADSKSHTHTSTPGIGRTHKTETIKTKHSPDYGNEHGNRHTGILALRV